MGSVRRDDPRGNIKQFEMGERFRDEYGGFVVNCLKSNYSTQT